MTVDSDDDDTDSRNSDYQFSTPDGLHLARKVLRPLLPYDPHDDQLEGICKMIDGINLMALTRTGSGKTGYFTMYMLFLLALSKDPRIVAPAKKSVRLWFLSFQLTELRKKWQVSLYSQSICYGFSVHLPYTVEIVAMYFFCTFTLI